MIDLAKMIRSLRDERGWTQEQLARRLNCSKQTINNYEHSRRAPSYETLALLADVFNVPIGSLIAPEDPAAPRTEGKADAPAIPGLQTLPYTPSKNMVPIIGSVRCGPGGLAFEDLQGATTADVANTSEYFYLRAVGDSMEPQIFDGDLVLVHIQSDVDSGALAVAIIDGEEGTLKKYIKRENAVVLQSFNPAYPPRVLVGEETRKIRIAGKVVQSIRKW